MKNALKHVKWLSTLFVLLFLGMGRAHATTFLQFDSAYLGDGWFQYSLQVMDDPFFTEALITGLQIDFTNEIDFSTNSENWTQSSTNGGFSQWAFQDIPPRPYSEVFLIQSADTAWRQGTNGTLDGGLVLLSLYLTDENPLPNVSENIVGYANLPCLVPCAPEQADGSPPSMSYTLKLVPDITIQSLVRTNSEVYGVDFLWGYESTFLLQSSFDLKTWTNVGYVYSTPPETIWTTNQPLNSDGCFFRLELVADGYDTNLPPPNSNVALVKSSPVKQSASSSPAIPSVSGCQVIKGQMAVNIATAPNQSYVVSALDNHRVVKASKTLTSKGNSATAWFNLQSLPSPAFFRVASSP